MADCFYCTLNSAELMIRMGHTAHTTLYLHRDQSLPGRVIVATRRHFADVTDLPDDVHADLWATVRAAAQAARGVYPTTTKINLAVGGNLPQFAHPHVHVVPRHTGDRKWPEFTLDAQQPFWPLEDERYHQAIERLATHPSLADRLRRV